MGNNESGNMYIVNESFYCKTMFIYIQDSTYQQYKFLLFVLNLFKNLYASQNICIVFFAKNVLIFHFEQVILLLFWYML